MKLILHFILNPWWKKDAVPNCPFIMLVINCPFYCVGAKLSWCQIVRFYILVTNHPFFNSCTKLSGAKLSWCQIVRYQIIQYHQKNTQNFLRDWYLFGKRQLFSLNNFFQSWLWLELRIGVSFLGPKSPFLAEESNFCHTTPILVNSLFVALGEAVHFPS